MIVRMIEARELREDRDENEGEETTHSNKESATTRRLITIEIKVPAGRAEEAWLAPPCRSKRGLWVGHLNEENGWRELMESMDDENGWRVWMERMDGENG